MRLSIIVMAVVFAFGVTTAQDMKIIRAKHQDPQVSIVKDQLLDMSVKLVALTAARDHSPADSVSFYSHKIRLLKAEIKIQLAAYKAEQAFISSPDIAAVSPIDTTY